MFCPPRRRRQQFKVVVLQCSRAHSSHHTIIGADGSAATSAAVPDPRSHMESPGTIGAIFMKFGLAPATMAIVFVPVVPDLKASTLTSGWRCELIDKLLGLADVASAGCAEYD